jgi:hypothetical protein
MAMISRERNHIGLTTVYAEINAGRLIARKIGRRTVITVEDLIPCRGSETSQRGEAIMTKNFADHAANERTDALIAGEIDVAIVPQLDGSPLAARARRPRHPVNERGAS